MKKFISIFLFGLLIIPNTSCKKKVVDPNTVWVGVWRNGANTEMIQVWKDGTGIYENVGGAIKSQINGTSNFPAGSLEISSLFVKKKFSIDASPVSCNGALNPVGGYSLAILSGQNFYKTHDL